MTHRTTCQHKKSIGVEAAALCAAAVCCAAAGVFGVAACGGGGVKSEVIEFCTPILVDRDNPPMVHMVIDPGEARVPTDEASTFLVATEVPITTVDATAYAQATGSTQVVDGPTLSKNNKFVVVDALSMAAGDPVVGRAVFEDFSVIIQDMPQLGPPSNPVTYPGILGGDMLRRYAMRLHYEPDPECDLPWTAPGTLFPTITFVQEFSDDDKELAADGFAVIDFRLAGGGTFVRAGNEVSFGATRVAVGACLAPDPFNPATLAPAELNIQDATPVNNMDELEALIPQSGADGFLLVATGTHPLVLGQQAFDRLQAVSGLGLSESQSSLYLMEGRVDARRIQPGIPRVALTGDVSDGLSPCGELARRRRIQWIDFWGLDRKDGTWRLNAGGAAVVEFREPVSTFTIADTTELLQGIRFEMTPDTPQIDGFIGHDFLHHFELVLDYPGDRTIFRCGAYRTPDIAGCPDNDTLDASGLSCCASANKCYCPPTNPCCQYPRVSKP